MTIPYHENFKDERERLAAINAVADEIKKGYRLYDEDSDPQIPYAPSSHYRHLAERLTTIIRGEHRDDAIRFLSMILPCVEFGCQARRAVLVHKVREEMTQMAENDAGRDLRNGPPVH